MISREEYKIIVESSPNMIWRAGTDAKCNYFNETWLAFTGRSMAEEEGDGWTTGVHPDDFQRCVDIYLRSFAQRESFEMEYRLRRHDGAYRWINDRGVPVYDKRRVFLGYIGSCMDVTEKVEGEALRKITAQLQISEERLAEAQHLAKLGNWEFDPNNLHIAWSQEMFHMYRQDPAAPPPSFTALYQKGPQEYLDRLEAFFSSITRSCQPQQAELPFQLPDGQEKHIYMEGYPVFVDNQLIRIVGISQDITERYHRERQLAESEARYRALMEQSSDAILLFSQESNCYVEANPTFYQLTGYTPANLSHLAPQDLLGDISDWNTSLCPSQETPSLAASSICRVRCHNGSIILAEGNTCQIHYQGRQFCMTTLRDITAQKKLEEELKREVAFAAAVQRQILPADRQGPREIIQTIFIPHHLASGDFFNFSHSRDGSKLRGYIMDCTGHGIGAALQTSALNVLMENAVDRELGPVAILEDVNEKAVRYLSEMSFAAILYFEVDYPSSTLTYVAGGITSFLASCQSCRGIIKTPGPLVGIQEHSVFHACTLQFASGDTFYFMTDGLWELLPLEGLPAIDNFAVTMGQLTDIAHSAKGWDDISALCLHFT